MDFRLKCILLFLLRLINNLNLFDPFLELLFDVLKITSFDCLLSNLDLCLGFACAMFEIFSALNDATKLMGYDFD